MEPEGKNREGLRAENFAPMTLLGTTGSRRFSQGTRRGWCLMMEELRLDFDCTLDRVGDETILFSFFQDARYSREIAGTREHDPRSYNDLGNLVTASFDFF